MDISNTAPIAGAASGVDRRQCRTCALCVRSIYAPSIRTCLAPVPDRGRPDPVDAWRSKGPGAGCARAVDGLPPEDADGCPGWQRRGGR